ncbi:MAG TPA: zf-TFIIB domain-containing protein [Rhizomicrobium sp.]|nr:zf-TFIIB domain-containing protein [Rhizomicrobium sp.]
MKCPDCKTDLTLTKHSGVEMELCPTCKGMWLTRRELNQLEDEVFDLGDAEKGSLMLDSSADTRPCPECAKPMNRFDYRFYDLEMDFCGEGHGFWLEAGEDARVLELMKKEETGLERKVLAEDKWASTVKHLRSGSFIDRLVDLFR